METPILFNNEIFGVLHIPKKKSPLIIMCHGWGANKLGTWQGLFVETARELCKNGFAVLRFDFRGSGDSKGEFRKQTIKTMLEDLDYVLDNLKFNIDGDRIGLIGHSLGGKVAILKAAKDKRIKCLAVWSTPALHQDILSKAFVDEVKEKRYLWFNDIGYGIDIKQLESCLKYNGLKALRKIKVPILIVNGSEDESVPPSHANKLYKNANKPKKLVILKGANHAFLNNKEVIKVTRDWFNKWLPR